MIDIKEMFDHSGNKLKHVRIQLVKGISVDHDNGCEGCIFYNEEEQMDCSLIGSQMSCVVDMHHHYVWKNVLNEESK